MAKERQHLDSLAPSSSSSSSLATRVKYRKPPSYAWTQGVNPAALPQDSFTSGKEYVGRWQMPPPVQSEVPAAGDLMSALEGLEAEASSLGAAEATQAEQAEAAEEAILEEPAMARI